jgi:deoxyribonuclease-4
MGRGAKSGIDQLVNGLRAATVCSKSENEVVILLENNVGQKNSVGSTLEELRLILDRLDNSKQFGLCIDTCHLFASGYDLRTKEDVNTMFEKINSVVGLKELKIIHLNDSKGQLGSNLDRHQHIGLGSIGIDGITALVNHRAIHDLPMIMETPIDTTRGDVQNLRVVLDLIKK